MLGSHGGTIWVGGGVRVSFDEETTTEDLADLGVAGESMLLNPNLGCLLLLLDWGRGLSFIWEVDLGGVNQ